MLTLRTDSQWHVRDTDGAVILQHARDATTRPLYGGWGDCPNCSSAVGILPCRRACLYLLLQHLVERFVQPLVAFSSHRRVRQDGHLDETDTSALLRGAGSRQYHEAVVHTIRQEGARRHGGVEFVAL